MRFTFLLPNDDLTGGARVIAAYASELGALGHEVLVVTAKRLPPTFRERWRPLRRDPRNLFKNLVNPTSDGGGHVSQSGVPHRAMVRSGPILETDVPDADVIVATWWEKAVWMDAMSPVKGKKVHLIQGYEIWFGPVWIPKVHAALCLQNIKIAISRDLKSKIEQVLGPLGIEVVGNAIDTRQFDAPLRPRRKTPTVGFVYATAAIKGADICGAACELAREQIPNLRVISFGAELPSKNPPLPRDTRYTYRPPHKALCDLYASCDVWLFGSRVDSFGLPILEAMACRTPVIAVPVGAAVDLIGGGGGQLVANESSQAMADAIVSMINQPEINWQRMSAKAHATANRYTWRDAAEKLLEVVNR